MSHREEIGTPIILDKKENTINTAKQIQSVNEEKENKNSNNQKDKYAYVIYDFKAQRVIINI